MLAFFALGQMAVQKVLATNPALGLNVALGVYMGQIVVLFILLAALRNATFFDPRVFAGTIVACALVWTAMIVYPCPSGPRRLRGTRVDIGLVRRPGGHRPTA